MGSTLTDNIYLTAPERNGQSGFQSLVPAATTDGTPSPSFLTGCLIQKALGQTAGF